MSALLLLAASAAPPMVAVQPAPAAPLTRACAGRDGWSDEAPPARLFANVHYVGTCGITVLLVTSPRGHVLIDGATSAAAPSILANIRRLGFAPKDVRVILNSHAHFDHAGGLAALKAATGARLIAHAAAAPVLQSGVAATEDPQYGIEGSPPVAVDRLVRDGETIRVGPLALTAHATAGHAPGGTSWTWRACEARRCVRVAYADSLTAVARAGYRFGAHPRQVTTLRRSFATVAALPCDVLITPHPSSSRLFARIDANALVDPTACRTYAGEAATRLDQLLVRERASAPAP